MIEYYYIIVFVLPALLALMITPGVIRYASLVGAMDQPNQRKIHRHPTPRLGGVSICISFLVSLLIFLQTDIISNITTTIVSYQWISFVSALVIIFFVGVADDIHPMNPGKKFFVQAIAASIVYAGGFKISTMTSLLSVGTIDIGLLDYPLTLLWIVGITNAFNLIDGLDGLATGVGIIAAGSMFLIAASNGHYNSALVILALAGSLAGFLFHNFHPAKIFLGDSGSLLIGFLLAVIAIHTETKGSTAFALVVPMLALGLPIMDTTLAMIRRLLFSLLPDQRNASGGILTKLHSMFLPDRKHIHHQLISLGLSHRNVVLVLYCVSFLFGIGAFAVTVVNTSWASFVFAAVGIAMFIGVRQLQYKEMAILSNGILLPIYEWPLIRQRFFQGFLDLAFCVLSSVLAFNLTKETPLPVPLNESLFIVAILSGVQIAVFYSTGLYDNSFRYASIAEFLQIAKACFIAVLVGGGIVLALWQPWMNINATTVLTDFYILASLVAGSRMSFHILNFLFERKNRSGHNVLIYGARANGILLLNYILHNKALNYNPVGFLDDDPTLEGKRISGYTVLGGHWFLKRLLKKYAVNEILIASDTMKPEALRRTKKIADEMNVPIRKRTIFFEEVDLATALSASKRKVIEQLEPSVNLRDF
ncbi:MAG: hypothetical protein AB1728_06060 [Bacteroidota bacterium]